MNRGDPAAIFERVLAAVDLDAAVALLTRLVAAPSENPPGDEAEVAVTLAEALDNEGIEARLDQVFPGRPNLTATLGEGEGPTLLLNGHMDTMPAGSGWESPPHSAVIHDGRLYGLGSCDMKAGLAAMTEAVCAMSRAGVRPRGQVILDAVVDEEGRGCGTKQTLRRGRKADCAIIAEPTQLAVVRLGNGQVNFDVSFHGEPGHGSTPEVGHNAIYDAAAFVAEVERAAAELAGRPHPLVGPASYNIGVIAGGLRTSIIPGRCTVGVDRRITPGQTPADARADLDRLLTAALQGRQGARAEWNVTVEYPPFETPEHLPVCQELRRAVADVTGSQPPWSGLRATTDAAFLAAAGIPAVVFGPGSLAQAHRPNEYVDLEDLDHAIRALALAAIRLVG